MLTDSHLINLEFRFIGLLYYFQYSLFILNFFSIKITKFPAEMVLQIYSPPGAEFCLYVKEMFYAFH